MLFHTDIASLQSIAKIFAEIYYCPGQLGAAHFCMYGFFNFITGGGGGGGAD